MPAHCGGARGKLAEFFEGGAGAGTGFLVVFFALRHREGLLEGEFGGVALAVREQGEAEFHAVSGEVGGEFGGALEEAHGFGGRSVR